MNSRFASTVIRRSRHIRTKHKPSYYSLSSPSSPATIHNHATTRSLVTLQRPVHRQTSHLKSAAIAASSSSSSSSAALSKSTTFRYLSTDENDDEDNDDDILNAPREAMAFDVLIVGGGPAGLAAAIRIKQLDTDDTLSVCVMEKGSEIGAHILSGNVFDPRALDELFPPPLPSASGGGGDDDEDSDDTYDDAVDWRTEMEEEQGSKPTPVTKDEFLILPNDTSSYTIPSMLLPPQLHNDGNYVMSLGQLCRYLGSKAEEMGVEVYPGFAASEVLYTSDTDGDNGVKAVKGIATRDMGIGKDGKPKDTFERGVELHARQTLFAEGARGSCSLDIMEKFNLRKDCVSEQTYGLGIKEVWEIPEDQLESGFVQHTLGYPLQSSLMDKNFGGTFLYHQEPNLVHAGLVIGLDYENPYINPYKEFQRWKTHPDVKKHFENGSCISYGARVLNEGGYHAIPKLTFKGGALIGCSAGFLNSVKIKGSHTAIKSGMLAAESVHDVLVTKASDDIIPVSESGELDEAEEAVEIVCYEENIKNSWVYDELYEVRNTHQAFAKWGLLPGLAYAGLAAHITKGREPWTLEHGTKDSETTRLNKDFKPIDYPSPDGVLTFDLLTNLQRSGTYHDDDQQAHLRIKTDLEHIPQDVSMQLYGAPEQRFCPAGVYEYISTDNSGDDNGSGGGDDDSLSKLVINAQNCVHCKCCSIKMPGEYIEWTVPEGGGGPNYQVM